MTAVMEVGGGQAVSRTRSQTWRPERGGVGWSLTPEAQGALPCFFALNNKYPFIFYFFQWLHLLNSNSLSKRLFSWDLAALP